jgi:uncharacterized protein YjiS (DUF1127 family)
MIATIKLWFARRQIYNTTHRELDRLTNHELRDLGINREMITRVALETAYGYRR